jgi:hypothetical protein
VTEDFGQLYAARKPQKSKKLGGHSGTRLVIILAISKNPDTIEVKTEYIGCFNFQRKHRLKKADDLYRPIETQVSRMFTGGSRNGSRGNKRLILGWG